MAKTTIHTETAGNGSQTATELNGLFEANGVYLTAAMQASEAMLKGMTNLQHEMIDFASRRLKEGFRTSESLTGCRDAAQAYNLQCDFAHKATQQYLEETSKLITLAAEVTRDCLAPIEDRTRAALSQLSGG